MSSYPCSFSAIHSFIHPSFRALQAAVSMGHYKTVFLLLFWGAAIDAIDAEGRTVLGLASQQGSVEVVRLLLNRGLDETHRDNSGWTPLHIASFEGHKKVMMMVGMMYCMGFCKRSLSCCFFNYFFKS